MQRALSHVRQHVIAYLALACVVLAAAGGAYAAVIIPNGSITAAKLDTRSIGGYVLAWAHVSAAAHVMSGSHGAVAGSAEGTLPNYGVAWRGVKLPGRCVPMVTPGLGGSSGAWPIVKADLTSRWGYTARVKTHGSVTLEIADSTGQPLADSFYLAVVC
jgi:hypothetical protein